MSDFYQGNYGVVVETTLAAAVADAGTFTVGYPTGFVREDFNAGLIGTGSYAIVAGNDRWAASDSDVSFSFGASEITVTNSSGVAWAAGSSVAIFFDLVDGNDVAILTLPLPPLASITAADVVTEIRPGIDGTLEYAEVVVTTAVTTAAKAATLNFEIDTTNCTGGTIALTSANMTPLGAVVASSAFTANNRLYRKSKLSVEAASVTAFSEGAAYLLLRIRKTRAAASN